MTARRSLLLLAATALPYVPVWAQMPQASAVGSDPHAVHLLTSAVQSELAAADNDHTPRAYREHDVTADKDAVYSVVESPEGGLRRMIELGGHPVDAETREKETERLHEFVHDPAAQAKQRKSNQHDDDQARQMLLMLPKAFFWTIKSEQGDLVTLSFKPNPDFKPPNIEARVMGLMGGEMVIVKSDNRVRTLRGALTQDVKFGYGLFGKLRQGGIFDIERREIAPHVWQITETRVHIDGRALLFKTIGQQEDDIKSEWKTSTAKTLEDAAKQLGVE